MRFVYLLFSILLVYFSYLFLTGQLPYSFFLYHKRLFSIVFIFLSAVFLKGGKIFPAIIFLLIAIGLEKW